MAGPSAGHRPEARSPCSSAASCSSLACWRRWPGGAAGPDHPVCAGPRPAVPTLRALPGAVVPACLGAGGVGARQWRLPRHPPCRGTAHAGAGPDDRPGLAAVHRRRSAGQGPARRHCRRPGWRDRAAVWTALVMECIFGPGPVVGSGDICVEGGAEPDLRRLADRADDPVPVFLASGASGGSVGLAAWSARRADLLQDKSSSATPRSVEGALDRDFVAADVAGLLLNDLPHVFLAWDRTDRAAMLELAWEQAWYDRQRPALDPSARGLARGLRQTWDLTHANGAGPRRCWPSTASASRTAAVSWPAPSTSRCHASSPPNRPASPPPSSRATTDQTTPPAAASPRHPATPSTSSPRPTSSSTISARPRTCPSRPRRTSPPGSRTSRPPDASNGAGVQQRRAGPGTGGLL